jgi:hypothetical protein
MRAVRTRAQPGPTGLTLVEFLIAISVIAFVGLGVAGMFPTAFRSVLMGGQITKATILARSMAEMVQTEPFETLAWTPSAGTHYAGVHAFDTRSASQVPSDSGCPPSLDATYDGRNSYNKRKCGAAWGRREPPGRVCRADAGSCPWPASADGTVNGATPCQIDLRRIAIAVYWDRQGSRVVNVVTHVLRPQ